MGLYESDHPDVPGTKGLHVFHFVMSNCSHELLFRPFRKVGPEEVALFEEKHADATLAAFMRDYSENGVAWQERVAQARADLETTLDALEARLEQAPWLSGDAYGLADISWVVNANRLQQAQVDLERWPRFREWATHTMARPAFDRAVASYRP
jgi:glutathione S-transferase